MNKKALLIGVAILIIDAATYGFNYTAQITPLGKGLFLLGGMIIAAGLFGK